MMIKKWLLAFALAGLSLASAKTYTISIGDPSLVGTTRTQLKPGDYTLKLEGSKAVLTNDATGKQVQANVMVATAPTKYQYTEVESRKVGTADHIQEIRLGGTNTKVEFD